MSDLHECLNTFLHITSMGIREFRENRLVSTVHFSLAYIKLHFMHYSETVYALAVKNTLIKSVNYVMQYNISRLVIRMAALTYPY